MLETIFSIVTNVIKFLYVYLALHIINGKSIRYNHVFVYTIIYYIGFILLRGSGNEFNIWQCMYTVGLLYALGKRQKLESNIVIPLISISLLVYEGVNFVTYFASAMLVVFFPDLSITVQSIIVTLLVILKCLIIYYILKIVQKNRKNIIKVIMRNYLVCIIYFLSVCFRLPYLYTEIAEARIFKMILASIICCTAIFFIISLLERRNAEKEKARVEEDNKLLTAKLHKSQEILPAMVQVLSDVTEKNGTEMEEHKAHKLLEEVSTLYSNQLKENGRDDLHMRGFNSTGLVVLDQQLNVYQYESIEKEVNFDIYVQGPIDDVVKRCGIDQLKLQRAIGDLIRNAFHAVKKAHEKGGHILLIIGCRHNDILEIAVMDDGIEFPLHVLETFGIRGVTTEGTGNGLADIMVFVKEEKASICVEEFKGKADSFTKKISIIFNQQETYYLDSTRKEQIKSSFWNN